LQIRGKLLGHKVSSKRQLLPLKQPNVPDAEKIKTLPEKYIDMIGEHADHPGTGKGRRATVRNAA